MSDRSATRYTFLGLEVPDALVAKFPNNLTLFDTWHRKHVVRMRTQEYVGLPNRRGQVAA